MSNFSKSADDIKSIAAKFKGFLELADALDKIGSVEQAARDAETKKNFCYEQAAVASEELEKAKKKLESAEAGIFAANAKAKEIENNAFKKAEEIYSDALDKIQAIQDEASKKHKALDDKFLAAVNEHNSVVSEIVAKKEELEKLKSELQQIKSKFASL